MYICKSQISHENRQYNKITVKAEAKDLTCKLVCPVHLAILNKDCKLSGGLGWLGLGAILRVGKISIGGDRQMLRLVGDT